MPIVIPFHGIRPSREAAPRVAALPYDVYNRKEAAEIVAREPWSFLAVDRAETGFAEDVDIYDDRVYDRAKELLTGRLAEGIYVKDEKPCYYVYELTMAGRTQTGIVACCAVSDYENEVIKKHENTRADKEVDRFRHVDVTNTHTGPIFLAYRSQEMINQIVAEVKEQDAEYDFTSDDGIRHRVWVIEAGETISLLRERFAAVSATYIADGHHRCASAVKVGMKRRAANAAHTGTEEYNYFLSVLFPEDQLVIMPYNRVVRDLNGLTAEDLIAAVRARGFAVEYVGKEAVIPEVKGSFGMYLKNGWYRLTASEAMLSDDPVLGLDVSVLQDQLLAPVLGVKDPKVDKRIDFVGGIRGVKELEKRVGEDMEAAFSMYATSIGELLAVADAGLLMPPKSTWFEPKLRSGLFLHALD